MATTRRGLVAGAGATLLAGRGAAAADFPRGDIQFIIPSGPGGGFDSYVREIIAPMQTRLPRRVNIVPANIDGAGGAKATTQLYHARPDGGVIGVVSVPGAIVMQLTQGLGGYDLSRLTWLCNMGRDSYGIAVGAHSPIRDVADLQALSRTRPVKFTSTGPASTGRAATVIATRLLGIRSQIIAGYKGTSDYLLAAARGDGDAAICPLTSMTALAKGGVIRIVASFEARSSIPGVPDAGALHRPELAKIQLFRPVAAPPRLPTEIQATLASALIGALRSPEVVAWAGRNDANLAPEPPEETARMIREQTAFIGQWREVLSAGA